jgi:hypothetical protein
MFALATTSILVLGGLLGAAAALEAFFYSIVAFAFVRYVEQHRRRFVLVYDLPEDARARFARLEASLKPLSTSWIRGVQASQYHGDWKRHGGATSSIVPRGAAVRHAAPPLIVTNLRPISISTSGTNVFFLPDRLLVRSNGTYAALSYESLRAESWEGRFVWDDWSLPPDAQVIGRTWQYKNKQGGPDRRFKNNRELPEIRMGYLALASETGLKIVIQSTNLKAFQAATDALAGYATGAFPSPSEDAARQPPAILAALRALGLKTTPSKEHLRKHYLELATRTHPDKLGAAGRDVRMLAEERMKEINAAYATLRMVAQGAPPAEEPLDLAPAPVESPLPWWRQPTTIVATAAVACCLVIFVVFRAVPKEAWTSSTVPSNVPSTANLAAAPQQTRSFTTTIPRACTVRAAPSATAAAVVSVAAGANVAVIEGTDSWRKVATPDGHEGWTGPACWRPLRTSGQACQSNADCVSGACRDNETGRACT